MISADQIDWKYVVWGATYERNKSIADLFSDAHFSEALLDAIDPEEELRAFSDEDLEAVRIQNFDNQITWTDAGDFDLLPGAVLRLVVQLYRGPARQYDCTYEIKSLDHFALHFYVTDWIGGHTYKVLLHSFHGDARNVRVWGDFLDLAYEFAVSAVTALQVWNCDRPNGEET